MKPGLCIPVSHLFFSENEAVLLSLFCCFGDRTSGSREMMVNREPGYDILIYVWEHAECSGSETSISGTRSRRKIAAAGQRDCTGFRVLLGGSI